jgi:hypothetical protein
MARPADAKTVFDFLKSLSHHEVHPEWLGHAYARQVSDVPDDSPKMPGGL